MWYFISAIFFLLYLLLWWQFPYLPYQDLSNHTVRSSLIAQLAQDPSAVKSFSFEFHFQPYILGDLIYAGLLQLIGLEHAPMLWVTICFLSFPLGLVLYFKTRRGTSQQLPVVILFLTYLSTNWFFLSSYANYCIGIGAVFFTLSCWESWQKQSRIFSTCAYCLYGLGVLFCYLLHLAPFFFCAIIISSLTFLRLIQRTIRWSSTSFSLLPILALGVLHLLRGDREIDPHKEWVFRSLPEKLFQIGAMFVRYHVTVDIILFLLFSLPLVWFAWRRGQLALKQRRWVGLVMEEFIICLLLTTCYFVLPFSVGAAKEIDGRALPFIAAFAVLLVLRLLSSSQGHLLPPLALSLSLSNLIYLQVFLSRHDNYLKEYSQALLQIPEQKVVLPVATRRAIGRIEYALHNAELYIIRKNGIVPYVFSRNTSGAQFQYFSYVEDRYTPHLFWYLRGMGIDETQTRKTYDFVIVTKPYDPEKLGLKPLRLHYENDAAAVFEVTHDSLS